MIHIRSSADNWESCLKEWPNWFSSKMNMTKRCPGLMKYFQSGIIVMSDKDYKFEVQEGELIPWNYNATGIERHTFAQVGKYHEDLEKCILKFDINMMFKCDTEDDYNGLFLPYDNMNFEWNPVAAIQPVTDNWQAVIVNTIFKEGMYHIKEGQPLAKLIFFETPKININNEVLSKDEMHQMQLDYTKLLEKYDPRTGDYYNKVKKVKACPFRKEK